MAPNTDEKTVKPLPGPTTTTSQHGSSSPRGRSPGWWKVQLFRGMVNDLWRRAPFYVSDWLDAWDYRVVPATVYMYFAKYVLRLGRVLFAANPTSFTAVTFYLSQQQSRYSRCGCVAVRWIQGRWRLTRAQYPPSPGVLPRHVHQHGLDIRSQ